MITKEIFFRCKQQTIGKNVKVLTQYFILNIKLPSKISENPLEHSNPYLNITDWCLGPYLQFLDPPGPMTGLWSIPGSGNYWTRYLIQRASGYMTGT